MELRYIEIDPKLCGPGQFRFLIRLVSGPPGFREKQRQALHAIVRDRIKKSDYRYHAGSHLFEFKNKSDAMLVKLLWQPLNV